MRAASFVLLAVLAAGPAPAGETPDPRERRRDPPDRGQLVTDRPDFTDSTEVVGPGLLQLELGFASVRHTEQGARWVTNAAPLPLLRLGLSRRFELRIGGAGYVWRSAGGRRRGGGMAGVQLGAKIKLLDEGNRAPGVALIPSLALPVGTDDLSRSGYDPSIVVAFSKGLPRGFAVGANFGFAAVANPDGRFLRKSASITVSRALALAGLSGFAEAYAAGPETRSGGSFWVGAAGVTRPLGSDVQVDFHMERSIAGPFPFWTFGAGLAFRGPFRPVRPY